MSSTCRSSLIFVFFSSAWTKEKTFTITHGTEMTRSDFTKIEFVTFTKKTLSSKASFRCFLHCRKKKNNVHFNLNLPWFDFFFSAHLLLQNIENRATLHGNALLMILSLSSIQWQFQFKLIAPGQLFHCRPMFTNTFLSFSRKQSFHHLSCLITLLPKPCLLQIYSPIQFHLEFQNHLTVDEYHSNFQHTTPVNHAKWQM